MSVPRVASSQDAYGPAKRRKVRKGTHSCWECKRRKMKCRFDPRISSTSCNGCRRRGSPCISQEFPENDNVLMSIATTRGDGTSFDGRDCIFTPMSTIMEPSQYSKFSEVCFSQLSLLFCSILGL